MAIGREKRGRNRIGLVILHLISGGGDRHFVCEVTTQIGKRGGCEKEPDEIERRAANLGGIYVTESRHIDRS